MTSFFIFRFSFIMNIHIYIANPRIELSISLPAV